MSTNDENSAKLAALYSRIDRYRNFLEAKQKSKQQSTVIKHRSLNNTHTLSKVPEKVPPQAARNCLNQPVEFPNQNLSQNLLGASTSTLFNRTVINKMKVPMTKSLTNQPVKFLNEKMLQSSSNLPINAVSSRTVVHNIKMPISSIVNPQKLSAKPVVKNSAMSWTSTHKHINYKKQTVPSKMTNGSVRSSFSSSSAPKLPDPRSTFKVNISASSLNVKLNISGGAIKNQSLQSVSKFSKKGITKAQKVAIFKKVDSMIEQLKLATETLSAKNPQLVQTRQNVKLGTTSVSSTKNHIVGNKFLCVPSSKVGVSAPVSKLLILKQNIKTGFANAPKVAEGNLDITTTLHVKRALSSPSGSITKYKKSTPLQTTNFKQNSKNISVVSTKLEKTIGSMPEASIKPFNELRKVQTIELPKNPVSFKKKVMDKKLTPLKSKAVGCHTWKTSSQINVNSPSEVKLKRIQLAQQEKVDRNLFKNKAKLLNSKYKVVNKTYPVSNSSKSLVTSKPIFSRKRNATFECDQKSKKLKTVNKFGSAFKFSPMATREQFFNKLYLKASAKKIYKPIMPLKKPKVHSLNSTSESKYKIINEIRNRSLSKVSCVSKPRSKTVFNFSTDPDLLRELVAEQNSSNNSTPKPCNRSVLFKRLYKSKNRIINKNVNSAQVKTANMIKSKYFANNKKYFCRKEEKFRNFSKFGRYQGRHKSFQGKFHSPAFYNPRRNHFKHRISSYANAPYFSRNIKRIQYSQNKLAFGTFKKIKRISGNHAVFSKVSHMKKISTPISKSLANRVLHRVLTASVKKKVSKVNTYCMFYNRFGRCNKGTKCTYVHDPSKIAICTRFLRGTCKSENCLFSHEICPGKMAICSFFLSGSCTKDNCPYRHEMITPGTELCKAFVKGYCPDGKECKKAHVLVCPEYVKGYCSKGDACPFPHPPPKERKAIEKATVKEENVDNDDFLMETVSRYFQASSEVSSNLVVPKRKSLPEQPSFISLTIDNES